MWLSRMLLAPELAIDAINSSQWPLYQPILNVQPTWLKCNINVNTCEGNEKGTKKKFFQWSLEA